MAGSFQVHVYDRQQKLCSDTFTGIVELGRQRDRKEALYGVKRDGDRARMVVAQLEEDTVSRDHAVLEPLPSNRIRLTNKSGKVSIRLADGSELKAGGSIELSLPTVIALGKKTIRILEVEGKVGLGISVRGLDKEIAPPMTQTGNIRFPTVSIQNLLANAGPIGGQVATANQALLGTQLEEIIRWLQTTMEVLQCAASSSDFFQKAAQAVVEIVGLDRGRVLLLENEDWKTAASWAASHINPRVEWRPSKQVLDQVRTNKRTFWQDPEDAELDSSGSLVGVEVVVASPILNPQGTVIGAIYGDSRQESFQPSASRFSRLEAVVVELLARGVAVGLARMEQERVALASRVQFEQFFTPQLAQQLSLNPDLLEGRDCEVTLLFCDIRGFSRISERLGPAGTVSWVSQVMGTLSDCVLKHQGVLVDYIGDELLAMWGAPVEQPDHAQRACLAALDMIASLPGMNERWRGILQEELNIGIGINTGVARVGNTGSRHKFKYGPLGNTVNLASRVQGATKYLKCPLLVTQNTQSRLGEQFRTRKLCSVRVVNIQQPVDLFELIPESAPNWPDLKLKYEAALKEFEELHFRPAARTLANLLGEVNEDGPSLVLMSRAVNALVHGVEEKHPVWDLPGK